MNEELLAASVLFVQSGAFQYWSVIVVLSTLRHLKGNYNLNSAFEIADRLLEQKRTGKQFHYIAPLTL
jgi:hypothetical protein